MHSSNTHPTVSLTYTWYMRRFMMPTASGSAAREQARDNCSICLSCTAPWLPRLRLGRAHSLFSSAHNALLPSIPRIPLKLELHGPQRNDASVAHILPLGIHPPLSAAEVEPCPSLTPRRPPPLVIFTNPNSPSLPLNPSRSSPPSPPTAVWRRRLARGTAAPAPPPSTMP